MRESNKKKACPSCGKRAPRIVSAFAISSGAVDVHAGQQPRPSPQNQHQRPLCMRYPQVPLSCHMDEYSVKRFAAHSVGRAASLTIPRPRRPRCASSAACPNPATRRPRTATTTVTTIRRAPTARTSAATPTRTITATATPRGKATRRLRRRIATSHASPRPSRVCLPAGGGLNGIPTSGETPCMLRSSAPGCLA